MSFDEIFDLNMSFDEILDLTQLMVFIFRIYTSTWYRYIP